MKPELEKLIKIKGIINKDIFHLFVRTNLEDVFEFELYLKNIPLDDYLRNETRSILSTRYGDSVEDLERYLKNHNGFERR